MTSLMSRSISRLNSLLICISASPPRNDECSVAVGRLGLAHEAKPVVADDAARVQHRDRRSTLSFSASSTGSFDVPGKRAGPVQEDGRSRSALSATRRTIRSAKVGRAGQDLTNGEMRVVVGPGPFGLDHHFELAMLLERLPEDLRQARSSGSSISCLASSHRLRSTSSRADRVLVGGLVLVDEERWGRAGS